MQREIVTTPERAPGFEQALGVLRQFRGARRPSARAAEHCELCSAELHPAHPHMVELTSRRLVCACDPCAMLFDGMERSKYKRVPRHVKVFAGFQLSDAQWESLFIPINLAFFFRSSIEGRTIALYPSPAGAVESLLTLEAWNSIEKDNPQLCEMQSDVEALLVNRISRPEKVAEAQYFIAPIDQCYKLVGLIRANWKGLSGGAEVWDEVDRFFAALRAQAEVLSGGRDA
jgi:hypothetical protein